MMKKTSTMLIASVVLAVASINGYASPSGQTGPTSSAIEGAKHIKLTPDFLSRQLAVVLEMQEHPCKLMFKPKVQ